MTTRKRPVNYLSNENLLREIALSKEKQRTRNWPLTRAECLTPRLVRMLMMLVDRYAQRGNFRGYCVDTETTALTQRGWLRYDEIRVNEDDIRCLDPQTHTLKWSPVNDMYVGQYDGLMFRLKGPSIDAFVTKGHKFLTHNGLQKIENILSTDKLILTDNTEDQIYFRDIQVETLHYTEIVWCPSTNYGTFVCKRSDISYVTGNSWIEDMKSDALVNLCQRALKFDRTKSQNPFGYYTRCIYRCFLTFLEKEKQLREIRDDLIEIHNGRFKPRHNRQMEGRTDYTGSEFATA